MAQGRIDFISFEEFKQLYKAEQDKKMKLCMLLGFGSGLRLSEIAGYKRKYKWKKKVKTEDNTSIPPLTADMIDLQAHQIRLEDAKGGKWRTTITSPSLDSSMLKLLPINMPRRTIQFKFTKLCKEVLGKKMSFHTLRHGFGNYMVNVLKMPLPMVQGYLGHSRLDTTGIYTKANPQEAISQAWKAMTGEEK